MSLVTVLLSKILHFYKQPGMIVAIEIINCFHYIVIPVILIISRTDPNKGNDLNKSMHLEHIIKISKF